MIHEGDCMTFGEILRTLMEEHDMTQKEVATALNIAPSTMGGYVQGTREPDFATLRQIAAFFRVSIDYLLNYHSGQATSWQEEELLRIFRTLTEEQRAVCVEQCRVFVRMNQQKVQGKSS